MQTCYKHACARPHLGYTQASAAQWASAHRDFVVARDFPSTTSANGHSSCHSHHSDKHTNVQQPYKSDTTLQPIQPSTEQTPQPAVRATKSTTSIPQKTSSSTRSVDTHSQLTRTLGQNIA